MQSQENCLFENHRFNLRAMGRVTKVFLGCVTCTRRGYKFLFCFSPGADNEDFQYRHIGGWCQGTPFSKLKQNGEPAWKTGSLMSMIVSPQGVSYIVLLRSGTSSFTWMTVSGNTVIIPVSFVVWRHVSLFIGMAMAIPFFFAHFVALGKWAGKVCLMFLILCGMAMPVV